MTVPATVTKIAADAFKSSASVADVYYAGSPSQWEKIAVGSGNTTFTGAVVRCEKEDNAVTGITVTAPAKTQYWKGETLDTTGMVVIATYSDGSTQMIAEGFTVTGFSNYRLGEQTVTVSYEGFTATFTVTVSEPYITEMILTPPSKLTYVAGEPLELWGMNVMVRYSDGRTVGIGSGYTVSGYNPKLVGEQIITVAYEDASATFTVTVTAPKLLGLEVRFPDKLEYELGEELDLTGMKVLAVYSDGSEKDVTDQVVLTGYDANTPGMQTVVVTFESEWVTFTATVSAPVITGIAVTAPTKTEYWKGEELDTTGMVVTAAYSNGSEEIVTEDADVTGYDPGTPGEQTVTVTYEGMTATFTVTVNEIVLIGIYVTAPDKTEYLLGEPLDLTGMVVTGNYSDGSSHGITNGYTVSGYDPNVAGVQWVSVSYDGCSMAFPVTVIAPAEDATLMLGQVTAVPGETVAVQLTMKGNPGIASAKLKVHFDSDLLTLTAVEDGGILGEAVHKPELTQPYTLCWANDLATENYYHNGVLATLYFTVAEDAAPGEYPITLSYGTNNGDIMDADLNDVYFEVENGSVIVENVQEEDDGTAKLVLDQVTAAPGETVEVKLSVKNNPGFVSALLKVHFDSSVLTLTEVVDAGVLDGAAHKPQKVSPYTLCWANDLAVENYTEDGTLVTLRFTVAADAPAGDYPITLSFGTDNGDIMDADLNDVAFIAVDGCVKIGH